MYCNERTLLYVNLEAVKQIPMEAFYSGAYGVTQISYWTEMFLFSPLFSPSPLSVLFAHAQNLSSSDPLCTAADVIYPQLGCGVFGLKGD